MPWLEAFPPSLYLPPTRTTQVGYKFVADKTPARRNQNQVGRFGLVRSRFSIADYQLSHTVFLGDISGSMGGERIASLRQGFTEIISRYSALDRPRLERLRGWAGSTFLPSGRANPNRQYHLRNTMSMIGTHSGLAEIYLRS